MTTRAKWRWAMALSAVLAVAVTALVAEKPSTAGRPAVARPASDSAAARVAALRQSTVTAQLTDLKRAGALLGEPSKEKLAQLMDAPGAPACAPPPLPAPTFPPGASYGIPFVAEITNGQVLAGYDEWTANHLKWTVHSGGQATTYTLYPWQSKIYDITGWVAGVLQLPSLTAQIPPQGIVFCDQGGPSCLAADWPAGQCIHILAQYGPSQASSTPPAGLGNDHPEGTSCSDDATPTFNCFPYVVSLEPSGTTSLSVSGVEANGSLDLSVTTSAVTTVTEVPPAPSPTFTCSDAPVTVTLSTVTPATLPATAPIAPDPPNTDDRTLQTPPVPLTGPLSQSTSTVGSDNLAIPAFIPDPSGSPCSLFLATSLNTYAGGWDDKFKDQDLGLYYVNGGTNPVAAPPGWAQFSATTTVVTFDLPKGPPANFSF